MSNIHQNDELLRVQDENCDIVFNYDKHENGGVAVHAEKDGQNQKVSPEYARAALVKKIGAGGGWPSDLPKPSEGGYGYTTEVTNEVEFIFKRPEAVPWWSDDVEFPEGLIIGESYEVTVNGVTGTYECFEYHGRAILGYPDIEESGEPGKWFITTGMDAFGRGYICSRMNLRPGETATIVISSIEFTLECDVGEVDTFGSGSVRRPEGLIIGESYEVTVNGVTGTYECFDDEGMLTLGYPEYTMALLDPGVWRIGCWKDDRMNVIFAEMNLRLGETATIVIKRLSEVHHQIDPKYLPEGGVGYTSKKAVTRRETIECVGYDDSLDNVVDNIVFKEELNGVLEIGKTYTVKINGDSGDYLCYEEDGNVGIGHPFSEFASGDVTIGWWQIYGIDDPVEPRIGIAACDEAGRQMEFEITLYEETVHTIDPKYIGGGEAMIVKIIYNESDDMFLCNHTYDEIVEAFPNIIFVDPEDTVGYSCFILNNGLHANQMEANVNLADETILAIHNKLFIVRPDNTVEFSVSSRNFD